jgi:hypothetical protein
MVASLEGYIEWRGKLWVEFVVALHNTKETQELEALKFEGDKLKWQTLLLKI